MKKAIFTGPDQPLKVVEEGLPNVPAEGALVKTLYSGVCHSDVHLRQDAIHLGGGQALNFLKVLGVLLWFLINIFIYATYILN